MGDDNIPWIDGASAAHQPTEDRISRIGLGCTLGCELWVKAMVISANGATSDMSSSHLE